MRVGEASENKAPYPSHSSLLTLRYLFQVRRPREEYPGLVANEKEKRNGKFTGRGALTSGDSENSEGQSLRERLIKDRQGHPVKIKRDLA